MPVHSESRHPITSSSSASSRSCVFTRLLQAGLDRVAVDTAILEVELVRPLRHGVDRVARHEPERDRLAAPAVLLARPRLRKLRVGRLDRASVLERLPFAILAKDLPDHSRYGAGKAGTSALCRAPSSLRPSASNASRTHCSCST